MTEDTQNGCLKSSINTKSCDFYTGRFISLYYSISLPHSKISSLSIHCSFGFEKSCHCALKEYSVNFSFISFSPQKHVRLNFNIFYDSIKFSSCYQDLLYYLPRKIEIAPTFESCSYFDYITPLKNVHFFFVIIISSIVNIRYKTFFGRIIWINYEDVCGC